jgi:uncharacterized protein YbaA (DUF1428 family)
MSYVEGFVMAVPNGNKQAMRESAARIAAILKEYGATRIVDCWGDDVPDGKVTDFRRSVKAEPEETVVFAWAEWSSRQLRDEANAKMRSDACVQPSDMPFDAKRMIFGGFQVLHDTADASAQAAARDANAPRHRSP